MVELYSALDGLRKQLGRLDADIARIGGLAVGARTETRFTRGVGLSVAVADDAQAQHLVYEPRKTGNEIGFTLDNERVVRLAMVRSRARIGTVTTALMNLLFCSSGLESEIVQTEVEVHLSQGLRLSVASAAHWLASKLLSNRPERPQDAIDIRNPIHCVDEADIQAARSAVRLIAERGFGSERDADSMLHWHFAGELL